MSRSPSSASHNALWGGRFAEATDAFVAEFTASVSFDRRLWRHDIQGSLAHSEMLCRVGVLSAEERDAIHAGLKRIAQRIEAGQFDWRIDREDVHMNIEAELTEDIGAAGKKLHTGRSRNDQVATDIRLYLRDAVDGLRGQLRQLMTALVDLAEREADTVMPGFTHLQHAQPISFGHHLLAWFEMLKRDEARFADCRRRINVLPLGSAALAGTSYPIDRSITAALLGFEAVSENSLDAVSDRDFAIEFLHCAALTMMHLSRWCEELILWNSSQFAYIDLPDRFCTGSSIMPQKKNPDVPELVRGKTGRVYGHLMSLLTLMKGQPLAYNKDNQEDKEPLFDTLDTLAGSLRAFADLIPALKPRREIMREAALRGFTTATDLADYLVKKGLPFRDAHEVVGKAVALALSRNISLEALPLADLQALSTLVAEDVYDALSLENSIAARDHWGGTAPTQVRAAAARARAWLASPT
ncbi:MAG: argininosuccinate lyase [Gammaproteobacteria bacterium]|nr:argininosuccinate lyase [Gammaproteobacteria bacterium]